VFICVICVQKLFAFAFNLRINIGHGLARAALTVFEHRFFR
jgi:hypothetical protein